MSMEMFRLRHSAQMLAGSNTAEIMLYGEIIFDMPLNYLWPGSCLFFSILNPLKVATMTDGLRTATSFVC